MENDEYLPFDYLPINGHPENGVMVGDILGWKMWDINRLIATEIQQWC